MSFLVIGSSNDAADEALDGEEGPLGIGHRLPLGRLADQTLAVVGEGDDRGRRAGAFRILDDLGGRAFHDGDARIGRAEVDADNFRHMFPLFLSRDRPAPKRPDHENDFLGPTGRDVSSDPLRSKWIAEDSTHIRRRIPPVAAYIGSALSARKARNRRIFRRSAESRKANKRLSLSCAGFYTFPMICPMLGAFRPGLRLSFSPRARARPTVLPGAAPAAPAGAPAATPSRKRPAPGRRSESRQGDPRPGPPTIDGRPLMLNGEAGLLQISGSGKTPAGRQIAAARRERVRSFPALHCRHRRRKADHGDERGRPDGLERFEVDVPACPFTFDVLDGAVLVPSQITACVFKAADCQTSPGGLWGPDGAGIEKDADAIGKRRYAGREGDGARPLHAHRGARQGQSRRRELCSRPERLCRRAGRSLPRLRQGKRARLCAASLTEARAALLEARLARGAGHRRQAGQEASGAKKKPKPAAAAAAQ